MPYIILDQKDELTFNMNQNKTIAKKLHNGSSLNTTKKTSSYRFRSRQPDANSESSTSKKWANWRASRHEVYVWNFVQRSASSAQLFATARCYCTDIQLSSVQHSMCLRSEDMHWRLCLEMSSMKEKSDRVNSFFSKSHLEIWQILTIAYLWFSPQTSNSSQFYFIYFVFHSTKLVINSIYSRDQRSSNTDGREKQQGLENYVGLVQLLSRCVSRVSSFASRRHDWRSRQGCRDWRIGVQFRQISSRCIKSNSLGLWRHWARVKQMLLRVS